MPFAVTANSEAWNKVPDFSVELPFYELKTVDYDIYRDQAGIFGESQVKNIDTYGKFSLFQRSFHSNEMIKCQHFCVECCLTSENNFLLVEQV